MKMNKRTRFLSFFLVLHSLFLVVLLPSFINQFFVIKLVSPVLSPPHSRNEVFFSSFTTIPRGLQSPSNLPMTPRQSPINGRSSDIIDPEEKNVTELLLECCQKDPSLAISVSPNGTRAKKIFSWGDDLNGSEWGLGMAIDDQGNMYIAGTSDTLGNGSWYRDATGILIKLNASGNVEWNITWGSDPVSEGLNGVAVDNKNGILYVSGRYGVGHGGPVGVEPSNAVLLKVNASNGDVLWEWRWEDSYSMSWDVVVDDKGNAYVLVNAVWDEGDVNGDVSIDFRDAIVGLVLFKFRPDGTMVWNSTYGVPRGENLAWIVAIDKMTFDPVRKEIYAAAELGTVTGTDPGDILLIKWNSSGSILWATQWHPETEYWGDLVNSIALDSVRGLLYTLDDVMYFPPNGNISSYVVLRAWNASTGELEWEFNYTYEDLHTMALVGVKTAVNQQTGSLYAIIFDNRPGRGGTNAFRINPRTGIIEWWEYLKLPSSLIDPKYDRSFSTTSLEEDLIVDEDTETIYSLGIITSWTPSTQPIYTVHDIRIVKWEVQPPSEPRNLTAFFTSANRRSTDVFSSSDLIIPSSDQQAPGVGGVYLRWQPPSDDGDGDVCGYVIYRQAVTRYGQQHLLLQKQAVNFDNENVKVVAAIKRGNHTSFVDVTVLPGVTYRYWIAAVNMKGVGNRSVGVTITIPDVVPSRTSATKITIFGGGVVEVMATLLGVVVAMKTSPSRRGRLRLSSSLQILASNKTVSFHSRQWFSHSTSKKN